MKRSYWRMGSKMADGFDRSRFVLDIMDFNLLYKYWIVNDGVPTTDILQNIPKQYLKFWCVHCFTLLNFLSWKNIPELRKMKNHLVVKNNGVIIEPISITHSCHKVRIYLNGMSVQRSHLKVQKEFKKKKKHIQFCWMKHYCFRTDLWIPQSTCLLKIFFER